MKRCVYLCLLFWMLLSLGQAQAILPTPEPALVPNEFVSDVQKIEKKVAVFLVQQDGNGQETLVPISDGASLSSGSVLEYQSYFTNMSDDQLRQMTVTLSIPREVYFLGVVEPDSALGSVDSQKFVRMPLMGMFSGQKKQVPFSYYKALRWTVKGLKRGDTVVLRYHAKMR